MEKMSDFDIDYSTLLDNVVVYSNVLKDYPEYLEKIKSISFDKWNDWNGCGYYLPLESSLYIGNPINYKSEAISETAENELYAEILTINNEIFGKTTNHFIKLTNYKLPNWRNSSASLCCYFPFKNRNNKQTGLVLPFHTDFVQHEKNEPGIKHGITANLYINDDYVGGEILFLDKTTKEIVKYKPKAGDMVVFPSQDPYYHAVNEISEGHKYFIRNFWHFAFEGTKEWHEEKAKYSEEEWNKKELKRKEVEKTRYNVWIKYKGEE
jgi:hypothetical protein